MCHIDIKHAISVKVPAIWYTINEFSIENWSCVVLTYSATSPLTISTSWLMSFCAAFTVSSRVATVALRRISMFVVVSLSFFSISVSVFFKDCSRFATLLRTSPFVTELLKRFIIICWSWTFLWSELMISSSVLKWFDILVRELVTDIVSTDKPASSSKIHKRMQRRDGGEAFALVVFAEAPILRFLMYYSKSNGKHNTKFWEARSFWKLKNIRSDFCYYNQNEFLLKNYLTIQAHGTTDSRWVWLCKWDFFRVLLLVPNGLSLACVFVDIGSNHQKSGMHLFTAFQCN